MSDQNLNTEEKAATEKAAIEKAASEKAKVAAESKKTAKQKYLWRVKSFRLPGSDEAISAEDAETDPDLIKHILSIPGQQLLKKLY